jgi:DNA-binding response OmpR family regulator
MARILLLDGDACLWNSVCDILEGEGYTVCRAHNDYEGLPFARTGSWP